MSSKIKSIHARQIVDCKCRPMVEVDVVTEDGALGRGCAPTGSSVGKFESFVLRDNNPAEYNGLSVHHAVDNVNQIIAPALIGKDVHNQKEIDQIMIDLDGTSDKRKLGGNAIYSTSIAVLRAAAKAENLPLYNYLANGPIKTVPVPSFNIINGGHYENLTQPFNEFIISPTAHPPSTKLWKWESVPSRNWRKLSPDILATNHLLPPPMVMYRLPKIRKRISN